MMKHFGLVAVIFLCLLSCSKKQDIQESTNLPDEKDTYLITATQVGEISRGMTIHQLYSTFSSRQIKHSQITGGYFNQVVDNYDIYSPDGRILLTVTPEIADDTSSMINQIIIRDTSYQTAQGINLNSTLKDIRTKYHTIKYLPMAHQIVVSVPKISTNFLINKQTLNDNWWDSNAKEIIEENIPDSTKIEGIVVYWTSANAPGQKVIALFTAQFWEDILAKFVTWCIVELPSIIILIALFIGLLRFIRFSVAKMKRVALNKAQRSNNVDTDEASKRINTLSGIIYGICRIFFWVIFLLILLSKFNINIAPILASAGIVGLAVGFGAQELVRDFISGFFILLENQLRTGDWTIINGTEGLVEKIELRTITLRDSSGTVHIFQNGKINTLSNMTKEWSAIVLQIGIAYKEDTDYACQLMQQVGDEMLNDPKFKDLMLEPITISGVNDFADSAVVIRLVLKTKPMQQWTVGREYRRRIKKLFDEKHVEFPFPYRTVTWGDCSNPIRLKIEKDEAK